MEDGCGASVAPVSAIHTDKGETVAVLYVEKRTAKQIKVALESSDELNKDFRMGVVTEKGQHENTIAVPVREMKDAYSTWNGVVGHGTAFCLYSSAILGNHAGRIAQSQRNKTSTTSSSHIERSLLVSAKEIGLLMSGEGEDHQSTHLLSRIGTLDLAVCPKKLEYLGDDRTVVLSRKAFSLDETSFVAFLESIGCGNRTSQEEFVAVFYKNLATTCKSPRIVRKGEIAPSSGIRESSYRLVWPFCGVSETTGTWPLRTCRNAHLCIFDVKGLVRI